MLVQHLVRHHVGPAPGTVDREESHRREVQSVQVMIGVAQQLGGLLGCRIGGQRAVAGIGFDKRDGARVAVHGRCGGEYEIRLQVRGCRLKVGLDATHGGVEQGQGAGQVDVVVELWVVDGGADAGHGCQVDHGVEVVIFEQPRDRGRVAHVVFDERKTCRRRPIAGLRMACVASDFFQIGTLAGGVVVVVQVVQADDRVAALEQRLGDVTADEAGGAGDEDSHSGPPVWFAW